MLIDITQLTILIHSQARRTVRQLMLAQFCVSMLHLQPKYRMQTEHLIRLRQGIAKAQGQSALSLWSFGRPPIRKQFALCQISMNPAGQLSNVYSFLDFVYVHFSVSITFTKLKFAFFYDEISVIVKTSQTCSIKSTMLCIVVLKKKILDLDFFLKL